MFDWSLFGTVMVVAVVIGLLFAWVASRSSGIDERGWSFFVMYLTVVAVGFYLITKPGCCRAAPLPAEVRTAAPAMPKLEDWVLTTGGRVEMSRSYEGFSCCLISTHPGVPAVERRTEGKSPVNLDAAAHAALSQYRR